ncbi:MAG: MdtA/MuxA family multidrug efflux RND transporter periplasmic adaptor subunit [Dechloromonas sp.]|nr:MdtA/MuxA family multidrug efflux RND transporter periplasmic adaptor subunit [Dechloromonas sp.]
MGIKDKLNLNRRARLAVLIGAVLAVGAGGAAVHYGRSGETTAGAPEAAPAGPGGRSGDRQGGRPQPVKATEARNGDLDITVGALGTVTASNTATVRPRVDGQLVRIHFREGQQVRAGDLLAEIDPRPFRIQLEQATGQLTRDEALLAAARVDLERYRGLLTKDSIAKQQVDTQEALVRQYRGVVEADQAQVDNARLQLGFTRITAPAAGRLGLRQVDVGNGVRSTDAGGIVVITQTQPIHAVFAIPADSLGPVVQRLQRGDALEVEAWDRDGRTRLTRGRLLSIDNQIDVTTGTVKLKAEFPNRDEQLFPNQFVNIRLRVEQRRDSLLLASAAVQRNAQGSFVHVIDPENQTVSPRPIRLGPSNGELVAVEDGLQAGERVVLDGTDRLRPGSRVEVLSLDGRSLAGESAPAEGRPAAGRRCSPDAVAADPAAAARCAARRQPRAERG